MRNEMIGAIVRRAIEHPEFRDDLIKDPESALSAHGFALEEKELEEIEQVRTELRGGDDIEQQLVMIAERYGINAEGDRPLTEQE